MALDGKILARAKADFEEKKRQHESFAMHKLQKVYAKAPHIRELDIELRATMSELVGAALSVGTTQKIEDIRKRNLELQKEREDALIRAGFRGDYLEDEYMCQSCHDTGYINSKMCECLKSLYAEEQRASLSNLFKLGNETFENFDLTLYDDTPKSESGVSPRQSMEDVYNFCVLYAERFGKKSMNLMLIGSPGLGKTFLSACIAGVVADSGFSVVYDMATSIFSKFEDARFQRAEEPGEVRSDIRRCMECDLLIIDDLGTEMTTAFTVSVLYEIINTRLINARKTIVNSNLTLDEMRRRYSEQIMSRLEGEYQVLRFYGDDIRKKRNML